MTVRKRSIKERFSQRLTPIRITKAEYDEGSAN